jgi:hypothetical protein
MEPPVSVRERVLRIKSQARGHVAAYLQQPQNLDECHHQVQTGERTPSYPHRDLVVVGVGERARSLLVSFRSTSSHFMSTFGRSAGSPRIQPVLPLPLPLTHQGTQLFLAAH